MPPGPQVPWTAAGDLRHWQLTTTVATVELYRFEGMTIMAVQHKAWEQVGKRFDSLSSHLRSRFDEVGADAAADRAAFEESLRTLMSALEETLSAAGNVVRDPVLRHDLAELAASLRGAIVTTFETAGEQVRERLVAPVRRVRGNGAHPHVSARSTAKPAAKPAAKKATGAKTAGVKAAGAKATGTKPAAAKTAAKPAPRKRTTSAS